MDIVARKAAAITVFCNCASLLSPFTISIAPLGYIYHLSAAMAKLMLSLNIMNRGLKWT